MTSPHTFDREEVMAYLDGELPAPQAATMRAHLERCGSCRAFAEELRSLSAGLGEWQVDPAPAVLDVSVRAALEAAPLSGRAVTTHQPGSRWRAWFALPVVRFAGAAAAIVIVAFVTWRVAPPRIDRAATSPAVVDRVQANASPVRSEAAPGPALPLAPGDSLRETQQAPQDQTHLRQAQSAVPSRGDTAADRAARGAARSQVAPDEVRPAPIAAPPMLTPLPATPTPPPAAAPPPAPTEPPVSRSAGNAVTFLPGVGQGQTGTKPTQAVEARPPGAGGGRGGSGGRGRGGDAAMARRANTEVTLDGVSVLDRSLSVEMLLATMRRPVEVRSVELTIASNNFDTVRTALAAILTRQKGTVLSMTARGEAPDPRVIDANVSIPIASIDAALTSLRELGRVVREDQTKDNLDTKMDALVAQIEKARRDEQEFANVIARAADPATNDATKQALARTSADRTRLEDEARRLIARVGEVLVTLRIEDARQTER